MGPVVTHYKSLIYINELIPSDNGRTQLKSARISSKELDDNRRKISQTNAGSWLYQHLQPKNPGKKTIHLLTAIDEKLQDVKEDLLKTEPLSWDAKRPHQKRGSKDDDTKIKPLGRVGDIIRGWPWFDHEKCNKPSQMTPKSDDRIEAINRAIGQCLETSSNSQEEDRSNLYRTHCGRRKHTRGTCFQLVVYPD